MHLSRTILYLGYNLVHLLRFTVSVLLFIPAAIRRGSW